MKSFVLMHSRCPKFILLLVMNHYHFERCVSFQCIRLVFANLYDLGFSAKEVNCDLFQSKWYR